MPYRPPMMRALAADDVETLRELLKKGQSRNDTDDIHDPHLQSPLMVACEAGSEKSANLLLEVGADPLLIVPRHDHYWPPPGWNAVCFARYGKLKRVEARLVSSGVSAPGSCLLEADFLLAVQARATPQVALLARQGKGRISDGILQYTVLTALAHKDTPLLQAVLSAGVPTQKTRGWDNQLQESVEMALYERQVSLVDALLDAGVRPPLTPLAEAGLLPQVTRTLEMGASANGRTGESRGPLLRATQNGHTEVVRVLLKAGANANGNRFDNDRPLLAATERLQKDKGNPELVKLLLKAGASTDVERFNTTPLKFAVNGCSAEAVSLLLSKMTAQAIASHPGGYLYAQALRVDAACPEAEAVRVLQALLAGGVRIEGSGRNGMDTDLLRKQADRSPAIAKVLKQAGFQ
ncbi:ankyrin repeat domain-containing protein [Corallococcus aberystwythensis]|nr:ankyrin repeat domain-containing protein [Corallococcus aberystwythensis]